MVIKSLLKIVSNDSNTFSVELILNSNKTKGFWNKILEKKNKKIMICWKSISQLYSLFCYHFYRQDLHTIDLEDFKFAKTKITSFRLVDSTNLELHSLLADWSLLASKRGLNNVKTPDNILVNIGFSSNLMLNIELKHWIPWTTPVGSGFRLGWKDGSDIYKKEDLAYCLEYE